MFSLNKDAEQIKVEREGETKFMDYSYCFICHVREVKDGEVVEEMELSVSSGALPSHQIWGTIRLKINETRFPNLAQSARYRNREMQELAKEVMRDFGEENPPAE